MKSSKRRDADSGLILTAAETRLFNAKNPDLLRQAYRALRPFRRGRAPTKGTICKTFRMAHAVLYQARVYDDRIRRRIIASALMAGLTRSDYRICAPISEGGEFLVACGTELADD